MGIENYWLLPAEDQKDILKENPVTTCALCGEETIKLVSCDVCGRSVCFACVLPADGITVTAQGLADEVVDLILCKECGTFDPL